MQEKKQTNKYLDDMHSDLDPGHNNAKNKERMSKKYKEMMAADQQNQMKKEQQQAKQNSSGLGLIHNTENSSNIDVYDYCDKMMKELGQDKPDNKLISKDAKGLYNTRFSTQISQNR